MEGVFIEGDLTSFASKQKKIRQAYLVGKARSGDNSDTCPCSACTSTLSAGLN